MNISAINFQPWLALNWMEHSTGPVPAHLVIYDVLKAKMKGRESNQGFAIPETVLLRPKFHARKICWQSQEQRKNDIDPLNELFREMVKGSTVL